MELADITSIYKNKGSRQDLKNDRGIFILPVVRKIVDNMIYCDDYDDIDLFMSDSNIGARKKNFFFETTSSSSMGSSTLGSKENLAVLMFKFMILSKLLMHYGLMTASMISMMLFQNPSVMISLH